MLVIARHDIQDAEKFWSAAKAVTDSLPPGFKLHSVFPSADMQEGTCLWEGPSVTAIQTFLDDNVGSISKNFCYEVNQQASIGLPKMEMEAAVNN
jgi:hypothetical protein